MRPGFSVVIPVYNVECYLERCIRSVLLQKCRCDFEIVLIDDGSTDNSPKICDDYAAEYSHIRVVHKENGGLSSARNRGIAEAQGEYIWFVDSDDWIKAEALEQLEQEIQNMPDIVRFGYYRLEDQRDTRTILPLPVAGADSESFLKRAFCEPGKYILSSCTHLYRSSFLRDNRIAFVSERLCGSEDYLFNLTALLSAKRVKTLELPLYYYELRKGSLTQQYKPDLPQKYTFLYRELMEAVVKADRDNRNTGLVSGFYVWHLIYGTCFTQEYTFTSNVHGLCDARKNVSQMLRIPEFREALRMCCKGNRGVKRWVQWMAMYAYAEAFFYWLFVVKPRK